MAKKNTFKEKQKDDKKPKSEGRKLSFKLPQFKNEKALKISAIVLMMFGLFLIISFTSHITNWKVDQDKIDNQSFWSFVFSGKEIVVNNLMGKFGAYVAHSFLYNWFGIASYLIAFYALLISIKLLFKKEPLPLWKSFHVVVFGSFWISLCLGFFVKPSLGYIPGGMGYGLNDWFGLAIGSVGTFVLILFTGLMGVTFIFNPSYESIIDAIQVKIFPKNTTSEEDIEDDELDDYSMPDIDLPETKEEDLYDEFEIKETEDVTISSIDITETIEEETIESTLALEVDEEIVPSNETKEVIKEEDDNSLNLEAATSSEEEIPEETDEFSVEVAEKDVVLSESELNEKLAEFGEFDPTLELSSYKLPPIELLKDYGGDQIKINKEELEMNKNRIVETLGNYNIKISKIKATVGPTVTLYEIVPEAGVRISKIKNLEDDIALSLAALGIRIIAPIPGKGTIGIEVPNSDPDIVSMRNVIASDKFQNSDMELPIVLGKTISNEIFTFDLTKMPHLLMAGATGQGKSVGLNAILVSILYKKHPSQVKFVLVDPKKVELTLFNKIERHFLAKLPDEAEAIITDTSKVVKTVNSLCIEMDNRYELLKNAHCRNLKEYNTKFVARKLNPENGHRYLPYIVLVIDEFADLIMTAGKEIETPIARLAQLARAIGIHLIVATQRPSANIITGLIKANFPARIAFRVTSAIDSRTILDSKGADQLIGRGDMLMSTGNDLTRIQCAFVDTPEVEEITDYIGSQRAYPEALLLPEVVGEESEQNMEMDDADRDELFDEAARLVVQHQQGSASLIQRKLKLGYNRAGRIIDQLEIAGIIGSHRGSKAREVLIKDELTLEQFLNSNSNNNEF